jgi:hypothetical protein
MYKDKKRSQGFRAMADTSMFQVLVPCSKCHEPVNIHEPHITKHYSKKRYHKSCFESLYI